MARQEKKPVNTTSSPKRVRTGVAIRLELDPRDAERLEKVARARGLSRASYARQAMLEAIRSDEAEGIAR